MGDTMQTVEIKDTYSKLKYTNKQTDTHTTETLYKFFSIVYRSRDYEDNS